MYKLDQSIFVSMCIMRTVYCKETSVLEGSESLETLNAQEKKGVWYEIEMYSSDSGVHINDCTFYNLCSG